MTAKVILLFVALTILAVAFAKRPSWHELDNYTFETFVQDFNLKLSPDSSEFSTRKVLFLAELARVKAHNARNLSWKEGEYFIYLFIIFKKVINIFLRYI
jgi:hypothetical protein